LGRSYRGRCGANTYTVHGQLVVWSTTDRSAHLYRCPATSFYHCSGCKSHSRASGNKGRSDGCTKMRMKTVERIHIGPSPCSEQLVDDEQAGSQLPNRRPFNQNQGTFWS